MGTKTLKMFLCIVFYIFFPIGTMLAADESKKEISNVLETPEQALYKALEYTGFEKSKTYSAKPAKDIAVLTHVIDSTTPSIRDTINSKSVWLVKFDGIQLQPFRENKPNDLYPKDFDVILDPETGNLLKINSSYFEFENDRQSENHSELNIDDPGGLQPFFGFPENLPSRSFFDVARVWHSKCTIGVKHISATYILQTHLLYGTKGFWCITFRGIVGPDMRVSVIERVIDPETGKIVATKGEMAGSIFGD